jgi:acetyl esterase/lipase
LFLPKTLYGKDYKKKMFAKYLNPEHEGIIYNLPPTYLMTSESDNLKRYTLWFKDALESNNIYYEFECYPKSENMPHAFSALYPERKESIIANKELVRFLKESLGIFEMPEVL